MKKNKTEPKTYNDLTDNTKKAISANANAYSKDNYHSINLKLKNEVYQQFKRYCDTKGLSRPQALEQLLKKNM